MAAACINCGTAVKPIDPAHRARDDSHLHFSGMCGGCGRHVQWHQTVVDFLGAIPVLGLARLCPLRCRHHDPAALRPSRR
jgi:hypothetical protein